MQGTGKNNCMQWSQFTRGPAPNGEMLDLQKASTASSGLLLERMISSGFFQSFRIFPPLKFDLFYHRLFRNVKDFFCPPHKFLSGVLRTTVLSGSHDSTLSCCHGFQTAAPVLDFPCLLALRQ